MENQLVLADGPGADAEPKPPRWSVAIMSSRERFADLSATISAVIAAAGGEQCTVDVVVNGNEELAQQAERYAQSIARGEGGITLRVWSLALGDKAHCINEIIHKIWPQSELAFFVDGYARVAPNAMSNMAEALLGKPEAVAVSGVPLAGRSAEELKQTLLTHGGMHGSLFAVRGRVMAAMRERKIRLPLGMYRTDGTMAAFFCFNLDPAKFVWDSGRIVVCSDAGFEAPAKSLLRLRDLRQQFDRKVRLAWGAFISQAIRTHLALRKRPPEALPDTALLLVWEWIKEFPLEAAALLLRRPGVVLAPWRGRLGRDWSVRDAPPKRLADVSV